MESHSIIESLAAKEAARWLEQTVRLLVHNQEAVKITVTTNGNKLIIFEVNVDQKENGLIIGKGGKIAVAIRTLIGSLIAKGLKMQAFVSINAPKKMGVQ